MEYHFLSGQSILRRPERRRKSFSAKAGSSGYVCKKSRHHATWDQMNKYFGLMQMPIITSRYWNMVHGVTPDQVKQDLEGMQVMRVLGK